MAESISRRNLLALAAPVAMLALPAPSRAADGIGALIEANDPVFAAIERHRKAAADYDEIVREHGRLEEAIPVALRKSSQWAGNLTIVETDDPRWIACLQRMNESDYDEPGCRLINEDQPTTMAGVMALLAYYKEAVLRDAEIFPDFLADEDVGPQERPFAFWLLVTVHDRLAALA